MSNHRHPETVCAKCNQSGKWQVPGLCYKCDRKSDRVVSDCACGKTGQFKTPGICSRCTRDENREYDPVKGKLYRDRYYAKKKAEKNARTTSTAGMGMPLDEGQHGYDPRRPSRIPLGVCSQAQAGLTGEWQFEGETADAT